MKGICHIWSRGRRFSPSLPVVGQVSESSKEPRRRIGISDARVEISGFIVMVQRSGTESRGTATGSVTFFVAFCLNSVNALVIQYAPLVNHSDYI